MLDCERFGSAANPYAYGQHQQVVPRLAAGLHRAHALSARTAQSVVVRPRSTSPNYLGVRARPPLVRRRSTSPNYLGVRAGRRARRPAP